MANPGLDESRDAESNRSHQFQNKQENNTKKLIEMQNQLQNYNKNVQSFINIRESNISMFNLIFEADETNMGLINEAILTYYLAKSFRIPKEKFKILTT